MFKTQAQIDEINDQDLKQIRLICLDVFQNPPQQARRPVLDDDGMHAIDDRDQDDMGELLKIPDGQDCNKLTIAQVLESADKQHAKLLETPWYVTEETSKDVESARHILTNAPDMLKKIPHRCRDFRLLPEQRLAIASIVYPVPRETYTNLTISRDAMEQLTARGCRKQEFSVKYYLERDRLPMYTVADLATGSGKTIMALLGALIMLVDGEKWNGMKTEFRNILYARRREQHSGLVSGTGIESMRLSRLCLCYVPGTVVTHWYKTAESAIFGMRETYGAHVTIDLWKGRSSFYSIKAAYESGRPTLWILPMQAESLDVETRSPDIVYAVRIMDELNVKMQKKYNGEMSAPLFTYIVRSPVL